MPASAMKMLRKILLWLSLTLVILLAIFLPVLVVTGMYSGDPFGSTVVLLGIILLAYGVAWYIRNASERF